MIKRLIITLIATALFAAPAMAGTYRNDGAHTIIVKNSAGAPQAVRPGDTIATVYVPADAAMTQISAEPYYNPLVARHSVSSEGAADPQTVTLSPSAATHVFVWKVTGGTATVYYDSTANTPAVAVLRAGDYYQHDLRGRAGRLVIAFSEAGTCEVLETTEPIR